MAAFGISDLLPLELSWAPPLAFILKSKGKMILKFSVPATSIFLGENWWVLQSFFGKRGLQQRDLPHLSRISVSSQSLVPSAAPWSSRCGTATPARGCQKRMGMRMSMWWVQDLFPIPHSHSFGINVTIGSSFFSILKSVNLPETAKYCKMSFLDPSPKLHSWQSFSALWMEFVGTEKGRKK